MSTLNVFFENNPGWKLAGLIAVVAAGTWGFFETLDAKEDSARTANHELQVRGLEGRITQLTNQLEEPRDQGAELARLRSDVERVEQANKKQAEYLKKEEDKSFALDKENRELRRNIAEAGERETKFSDDLAKASEHNTSQAALAKRQTEELDAKERELAQQKSELAKLIATAEKVSELKGRIGELESELTKLRARSFAYKIVTKTGTVEDSESVSEVRAILEGEKGTTDEMTLWNSKYDRRPGELDVYAFSITQDIGLLKNIQLKIRRQKDQTILDDWRLERIEVTDYGHGDAQLKAQVAGWMGDGRKASDGPNKIIPLGK